MVIPQQHRYRSVYHFTHLENLPDILRHGLLSTNEKERKRIKHEAICYYEIQGRRATMPVTCGPGGVVHDYVPFYFCKRSSMLLAVVMNKIADEQFIIHFQFPLTVIDKYTYVFTDASANTDLPPNFFADPNYLDELDWPSIGSQKWSLGQYRNQQRMAELLIHSRVDISDATRIIVWNGSIKDFVEEEYQKAGVAPPTIEFDGYHYFSNFYGNNSLPPVTGPHFTFREFDKTISELLPKLGSARSPKFANLTELKKALYNGIGCLPETTELMSLESDNLISRLDLGDHTVKVASELHEVLEFKQMEPTDKVLVQVAAFLHDIGKGPKSRWLSNNGVYKDDKDHPLKALPMIARILTEEVKSVSKRAARVICKLVCYHDLIGDIIGKGRRVEELIEVIEDERELNMLIALSKADILAVQPRWLNEDAIEELQRAFLKNKN